MPRWNLIQEEVLRLQFVVLLRTKQEFVANQFLENLGPQDDVFSGEVRDDVTTRIKAQEAQWQQRIRIAASAVVGFACDEGATPATLSSLPLLVIQNGEL